MAPDRLRISIWGGADITTVEGTIAAVRRAADEGFGSIWLPQTASVDTLTALAVAAHQVPGIAVGTAVVPIQGRHPLPLAQQALTVADAAGPGRFTLGIGVTHPMVSEGWYGVSYREVVAICREELEALDGFLSSARQASVEGEYLRTHASISMTVDRPGLLLAALGPRMLELAGQLADGTVTWMTGPRCLGDIVVPTIRAASAAASRPTPRIVVGLPVCATDQRDDARDHIRPMILRSAAMPSYQRMLSLERLDDPVDLAIIGSADEVTERLGALATIGATEVLANVVGTPAEQARTRDLLRRWDQSRPPIRKT